VGCGQSNSVYIIVSHNLVSLGVGPLVFVSAETGLINEEVRDVLSMLNRVLVVVDESLTFSVHGVEAELNFINTVGETEVREHGSLNLTDHLVETMSFVTTVEGGDRNESLKRLHVVESLKRHVDVKLVVEVNVIEQLLKLHSLNFVINECLCGSEV